MAEPTTYLDCLYDEERHVLVSACTVDRYANDEDVRVSVLKAVELDGTMSHGGSLDGILIRSVARNADFTWIVGKYGEVWTFPRGKQGAHVDDHLPDSGVRTARHLGPPNRIRVIDDHPYVCGFAGQIYTLQGGRWLHMDEGIVEAQGTARSVDVMDIHGTAHDDIYIVGSGGLLAHWHGRKWTRIQLLTTFYLTAIRALGPDHVVAVGDGGTLIELKNGRWTLGTMPGQQETYLADVEMFEGKLYVAAGSKLFVRTGDTWDEVRTTRLPKKLEAIRLAKGDGRLWVMGSRHVFSFDGTTWQAHVDGDNA